MGRALVSPSLLEALQRGTAALTGQGFETDGPRACTALSSWEPCGAARARAGACFVKHTLHHTPQTNVTNIDAS